MASRKFRSKKFWWLPHREKIIFLIFLGIFSLITPRKEGHTAVAAFSDLPIIKREVLPLPTPAPYPVNVTKASPPEDLTARSIMIVDAPSAVTLFTKNENEPLPPASTTKIMTALVALDLYKPEDIVEIRESTVDGQLMDLVPGEKMTVENLLYGLLIQSGNDAAEALAEYHSQGYQAFISAMNAKAQELSLAQTRYTNPIGLDDTGQRMSARDLARLSRVAIENPLIAKIVAIPQITISDSEYKTFHILKNINQLVGKVPGVSGIKTGWTEEAGDCLVTLVERNGHKVIIVVLKSSDRFADTTKLIDWVFSNYEWVNYGI